MITSLFVFFLLCTNSRAGGMCDLSNTPNIDGLHIGMTAREFLALHPTAEDEPNFGGNRNPRKSRLDFPTHNGITAGELQGAGGIRHIVTLDGVVYSYAISFLDAGASYETSLGGLKRMLIQRYHLPNKGWRQASEYSIKLQCANIQLEIFQDYGATHTAIGPTLFARDTRLSKIADSLK